MDKPDALIEIAVPTIQKKFSIDRKQQKIQALQFKLIEQHIFV
jgi:hypothetical protein